MKCLKYFALIACLSFILAPLALHAVGGLEDAYKHLGNVGKAAYGVAPETDLPTLVGKIINIFLSILGVLFVVLMVYGGYLWMTSYGDEKKVTRAKSLITDATIGLIIIILAYAIANFVVGGLITTATGGISVD